MVRCHAAATDERETGSEKILSSPLLKPPPGVGGSSYAAAHVLFAGGSFAWVRLVAVRVGGIKVAARQLIAYVAFANPLPVANCLKIQGESRVFSVGVAGLKPQPCSAIEE